jgi:hypothetical protein
MPTPDPNWINTTVARITAKYRPSAAQQSTPASITSIRCGIPCWPSGPACELPRNQPHTVHVAPKAIVPQSNVVFNGSIPSSTDATKSYQVVLYTDGTGHCTCRGYGYRRTCSHLNLVKEAAANHDD